MKIIDRRKHALGGQRTTGRDAGGYPHGRPAKDVKHIVWHYTAVARALRRFISDHERYWKSKNWSRGGYHYYIDADGNIYQNYNIERFTFGAGRINQTAIHISVEANSAGDYSEAQIKAREWLTLKLMNDHNIPANNVMGHNEAPGQSTSCPGYNKARMNEYRSILKRKQQGHKEPAPIQVDKKVPLKVSLNQLKFDENEWGTLLVDVSGTLRVLGASIMTRFGSPNLKSPEGGRAQPGWTTEFEQIAIAGGYAWAKYRNAEGRIKYIPFATYANGKIDTNHWVEFISD